MTAAKKTAAAKDDDTAVPADAGRGSLSTSD